MREAGFYIENEERKTSSVKQKNSITIVLFVTRQILFGQLVKSFDLVNLLIHWKIVSNHSNLLFSQFNIRYF